MSLGCGLELCGLIQFGLNGAGNEFFGGDPFPCGALLDLGELLRSEAVGWFDDEGDFHWFGGEYLSD